MTPVQFEIPGSYPLYTDSQTQLDLAYQVGKREALVRAIIVALLALILVFIWYFHPSDPLSRFTFLPIHTVIESLSIVVSMMIFGIGWHAYSKERAGNIVILGSAFLVVAAFDMGHTLSYSGMPSFFSMNSTGKAIDFWLVARFVSTMSLFLVAIRPWYPLARSYTRHLLLFFALVTIVAGYLIILTSPQWVPSMFVIGSGLTAFKVNLEYGIVIMQCITMGILIYKARTPQTFDVARLATALAIMGLSEWCFTVYSNVYDTWNLVGHLYKIVAYLYLYRAIFVESVQEPFRRLHVSENQLRRNEGWLLTTLRSIGDGVIAADTTGRITFMNQVAEQLSNWPMKQAIGKLVSDVISVVDESSQQPIDLLAIASASHLTSNQFHAHSLLLAHDGTLKSIEVTTSAMQDTTGNVLGTVLAFRDVTERRQMEAQVKYQAFHDALTRLPNRLFVNQYLDELIERITRLNQMFALICFDLDRFKLINDALGHNTGDLLLQQVADRLVQTAPNEAIIARWDGNEFLVVLPSLATTVDAARVAEKILGTMAQPFSLKDLDYFLSASIGISVFPADGLDRATLVRNAGTAMYRAKTQGNSYHFFLPSMTEVASEQFKLENSLRRALDQNEFTLHYQPLISLHEGRITSFEALLRWQHPEFGAVPPDRFIPLAEETGLIIPLGLWALRTACSQAQTWRDNGMNNVRIAVNLSVLQFHQPNLVSSIREVLAETGFPPDALELEITESVVMNNPETIIRSLRELRIMGVHLSLDDFGTGYSSLSHLKNLPLDTLKLDRSFISDVLESDGQALVKSIITLAHSLKLQVVAEGVETEEQLQTLKQHQCDTVQGYVFSRPIPGETCTKLFYELQGKVQLNPATSN